MPTAFTLMGLGMFFGFFALHDPAVPWHQSKIFDLMVERTFGAMNNETLISIPLFVLMGYVMERGALVDKMFYSVQLAFRRFPASLAVATLIVCTFWGIASGLVGAVVVLMGVIAFNPMLKAGYNVKLAAGVITAGGTLGILIPPSTVMVIYGIMTETNIGALFAAGIAALVSGSIALAVQYAFPVIAVMLLLSVGMVLLGRAVPAINLMEFGFALRVVVALGLMVLFLAEGSPFLVEAFRGILAAAGGLFGG
jgi:TRAP-type mannitol/chloroaromatic compound transport system permease large subunit